MLVDLIIILVVIVTVVRNMGSGFVRQLFSATGFFVGLLVGRYVETFTLKLVHTPNSRALVTVVTILGIALVGLTVGEYVGVKLKAKSMKSRRFNSVDNGLGTILTAITMLLFVWLTASVISNLPATKLKSDIKKSQIISALDSIMPPAPTVISDLGKIIDPNGFPDVFLGSEPIPKSHVNLPSLGDLAAAVSKDQASVVRIQGLGCGGIISGSGFVVRNDIVATNAHVVAGISNPIVEDSNGRHKAEVISFDPNLDLAILKVSGLAGKPLPIDLGNINAGTPGAVVGYPGGGSFNASPAAVMEEFDAIGQNIYGTQKTERDVYEIQADVIPGNSGGPLIEENGSVMGVVFAESTTYSHVGYALAMEKVSTEINQAANSNTQVSTRQCAE
jgi:S1-C subfamily serine protease